MDPGSLLKPNVEGEITIYSVLRSIQEHGKFVKLKSVLEGLFVAFWVYFEFVAILFSNLLPVVVLGVWFELLFQLICLLSL